MAAAAAAGAGGGEANEDGVVGPLSETELSRWVYAQAPGVQPGPPMSPDLLRALGCICNQDFREESHARGVLRVSLEAVTAAQVLYSLLARGHPLHVQWLLLVYIVSKPRLYAELHHGHGVVLQPITRAFLKTVLFYAQQESADYSECKRLVLSRCPDAVVDERASNVFRAGDSYTLLGEFAAVAATGHAEAAKALVALIDHFYGDGEGKNDHRVVGGSPLCVTGPRARCTISPGVVAGPLEILDRLDLYANGAREYLTTAIMKSDAFNALCCDAIRAALSPSTLPDPVTSIVAGYVVEGYDRHVRATAVAAARMPPPPYVLNPAAGLMFARAMDLS